MDKQTIDRSAAGNNYFNNMFNMFGGVDEMQSDSKGRGRELKAPGSADLLELIIRKSRNAREYRKYHEIVSHLVLDYYKRLGSMSQATSYVYSLIDGAKDINELMAHKKALTQESKGSMHDTADDEAKRRILNILFNDYKRRFQGNKTDAYNVLVLQSWITKTENTNELAILMDNILLVRDKLGNSWDYETHIVPILLDKSFTAEMLADYSNVTTNLIIGLSSKLKDSYLAVMTSVKILEYADSPKP